VEALNKEFGSRMLVTEAVLRACGRDGDAAPISRDPLRVRGREMPVRVFQLA
jgi:class 3 adenylate cyclase